MSTILEQVRTLAGERNEAALEALPEVICVEKGAVERAASYIGERGWNRPLIVADGNTFQAAGERLELALREHHLTPSTALVLPNPLGDVIADEMSIVQVLLAAQSNRSDAVVAAGSGTLHDIARYAAYTAGLPFVSVPTAASVDGFTSNGSPLLIRSNKITIPAKGPVGIFADPEIMRTAPKAMAAAGFGDMLGKYTSLFDWNYGRLTAGETYSDRIAELTGQALEMCVEQAGEIGQGTEQGLLVLTEALLLSGLAILLFGQSHPASGAEHHVSHYWEMEFIRTGRRQLLHGAKVGVACAEISALYHKLAAAGEIADDPGVQEEAAAAVHKLPGPDQLRGLLRTVGGPSTIGELGIEPELLERSLKEAHRIRPNRHTLLRARNEGLLPRG